jgi:hypothetical protein
MYECYDQLLQPDFSSSAAGRLREKRLVANKQKICNSYFASIKLVYGRKPAMKIKGKKEIK